MEHGKGISMGSKFWARGYAVLTVGFEEEQIRKYIRNQEPLDAKDRTRTASSKL